MAVGTGHGAVLAFLDPADPGDPSQTPRTAPGVNASPLGQLGAIYQTNPTAPTRLQLIRDLTLHEEAGDSADVSHLRSSLHRRYAKVDLYSVGTISFNVLFDTEIPQSVSISPSTTGVYDHPLGRVDPPLPDPVVNNSATGFFNGQAPVQILFPIRNPDNDLPAILGPVNAWIASRSFGNIETNAEHLCAITMQFETAPAFNFERATV